MISLYRPEQVREMDERTIAGGTPSLTLMERAAGHLARAVLRQGDRRYGLRVLLVCGKGNNAGDGIAAARRLRALGVAARIHLTAGEDGLSDDARVQLQRYRHAGGAESQELRPAGFDVLVDCLLGTGASGEPREPLAGAVAAINDHRADDERVRVVACDLPTGVDADTGEVPGIAVRADATLSLGAHKRGLWLWPARGYCGSLSVADIGLDRSSEAVGSVLEPPDVRRLLPEPPPDSHKRTRGVVVALAGSPGMTGAATLVARGAMAGGAGLVTVATATAAQPLVAPAVPEALTVGLPMDDPDAAFERLAAQLEAADALAVGPGLGHEEATVALVHRLVAEVDDVAVVLDADGLNAFRGQGDLLAKHAARLLVCTPHARELERLVDPSDEDVWRRRLRLVPAKSQSWDSVIVAKGPGSLVAAPDGRVWVNPTGTAALATGGTGDVMTGLLGAVVAQDADPARVAAAVWIHGRAGELAAAAKTPRSVTAGDVAAAIPAAFREVLT